MIGAGVIGSSIALELARAGHRVIVLDRAPGAGQGPTSASSAIVRFNFSTTAGVATAWEAHFGWLDWAGHLGHDVGDLAVFRKSGLVMLDVEAAPRTSWLWPSAFRASTPAATGRRSGSTTKNSGRTRNTRSVACTPRMPVTSRTRASPPVPSWSTRRPWSGAVNRLAGVGSDFTVGVRLRTARPRYGPVPGPAHRPGDRPGCVLPQAQPKRRELGHGAGLSRKLAEMNRLLQPRRTPAARRPELIVHVSTVHI
ncbi:FAD-dependent oxidoreductase [Amycolatopsis sp. NPDC005003]